jgi:ligand-binding sensor domain-containing protein
MISGKKQYLLLVFQLLSIAITIVWQGLLYAQPTMPIGPNGCLNIKAVQIGVREGLSQGQTNIIAIDKKGYLWTATKDGLNRFDGSSFKVFRHNADDTMSISDNFVSLLLIDRNDHIWTSTLNGKLDLFDRETETFIHVRDPSTGGEIGTEYQVGGLWEDEKGNLIAKTNKGVKIIYVVSKGGLQKRPTFKMKKLEEVYPALKPIFSDPQNIWHINFTTDGSLILNKLDTVFAFTAAMLATNSHPIKSLGGLIGW